MSTAGKVLTVCVTLTLLVWLLLMSMVARRNSEWGAKIKEQETTLARVAEEKTKALEDVDKLKDDLALAQELKDKDDIVARSEIADYEQTLTHATEILERVKNDLESQQAAEQATAVSKKRRTEELAQTKKQLADTQAQVEQLKQDVGKLLSHYTDLKKQFRATQAENQRLIQRTSR